MKLIVRRSELTGEVLIPASKSHTIRALVIATLADGISHIENPLDSLDTRAAVGACAAMGARVDATGPTWTVEGVAGKLLPPGDVIDVQNSGTTLYFMTAAAGLIDGAAVFTGDASIRSRPAGPLLRALSDLGAETFSTRGNDRPPFVVRGPMRGGRTKVDAVTSQFLSSLLIACPLADGETDITVPMLNEVPYVEMTLDWLDRRAIRYEAKGLERFRIPGGQGYHGFRRQMPGDFSSATFFLVAAASTDSDVTLSGLDMDDAQGDKEVVRMLEAMGAQVVAGKNDVRIRRGTFKGGEFDLNATPDALPAMAVAGALAEGETRLVNVAQARLKETDRIAVMASELSKMGAQVEEREDGLVVRGGALKGAHLSGHDDHRIVMALAVAGVAAEGETVIDTAESAAVTFPHFVELMTSLGADVRTAE